MSNSGEIWEPYVSVIMPIRNEEEFIAHSLGAILAQDYPPAHLEVLVIDGCSTDRTREIIYKLSDSEINIRVLDNPARIVAPALNKGIQESHGDVIVRVDGHTIVDTDYIQQCVKALQRHPTASNVGGRMNAVGRSPFGKAIAAATSSPFGVGGARFHYSSREEWVDTVYMGAWPRQVFSEVGLFDEELVRNQDDEFNYRLRKYGGKILLVPQISSYYFTRSTPRSLWRQYFEYGVWKVRVLQKHPAQMRPHQFVPLLFVISLLSGILLTLFFSLEWYFLAAIVGLYLVANLVSSLVVASRIGWAYLPHLSLAYLLLHFGYGCGFLVGLFKFWNRWEFK